MLLEYNVDTKDENMVPRAIELRRRVAGRKLVKSVEEGVTNADSLLAMKERNRDDRKDQMHDSFSVSMAGIHSRIAVARAEQQLQVESKVRLLERDVSRASRLGKSRMDALTDLEQRVTAMRTQLKDSMIQPVDAVISRELRTNNKVKLERLFTQCKKCNRRILLELIGAHENMCAFFTRVDGMTVEGAEEMAPIYSVDQDIVTSIATFAPQPPRNCRVVNKGATFIEWFWEPPVIDGGLPVTEYELSYVAKVTEFDKLTGKYKKFEEAVSSLKTSRWVFSKDPVCHNGFRMTLLRASTEYTNFKIRCMNLRGWSPWVDMLVAGYDDLRLSTDGDWRAKMDNEAIITASNNGKLTMGTSVFTNPPECPSPPLYFTCTLVTSSCIHLNWQAPFFDGGSEVVDYFIHYTELEKQVTVTARDVIVPHKRKFRMHSGSATEAVIRNIFSDADVVDVYIEAVNKVGLVGERETLRFNNSTTLHTGKACRFTQLSRELAKATASIEIHIDTAFFTGVRQRLLRVDHMRNVTDELSVTEQDPLELEEAKEWAAILEIQQQKVQRKAEAERLANEATVIDNDSIEYNEDGTMVETKHNYEFTFRQRRVHFKRKILALDLKIAALGKERMQIDQDRVKSTMAMKSKEKRLLSYKLEYERLKHYTGTTVTSSVLAGSNMQYKVLDYREKVDKAFDTCINEISTIKYKVILNENRRKEIITEIERAEELRKDRQAKFLEFDLNYQKTLVAMERLNLAGDQSMKLLTYYFKQLKAYKLYRQRKRDQVTELFTHVIFRYKRSAFAKWRSGNFHFESSDTQNFISVGSILLQQSQEKRIELQGLLRGVIAETATIKQSLGLARVSRDTKKRLVTGPEFKQMEEGMDHFSMHTKGMHFLYEGDGYAFENKFQQAKHNYEAQIWFLRSRPGGVDIKMLAICHGRLGKMFLKLGKKNRAIVEFDRQLSLAKEIGNQAEEAEAYFGLGSGYLDGYDYDNAIRYLNIAAALLEALRNGPKYCGALVGLRECYARLGKEDKVALYTEKIELVENDLKNKLLFMNSQLADMQNRLVTTAAEIEHVVNMERITNKALQIKRSIEGSHEELSRLEKQVAEQEMLVGSIEMLMDAIANELSQAIDSDEGAMLSMLVHDQPQVIEIEELKVRLNARSTQEFDRLTAEKDALRRMKVAISNTENNIQEADQLLVLENGALMRHSRLDKPFRCIGLCQSNVAGNEVTGTATGGFEEFAAAEGVNVHMLDYHSGALVHIFVGGTEGEKDIGHTGVVTCLCHDGNYLFSGATDELIICWNTITRTKVNVMRGHEGSIVSLAVETTMLVSGGSDATLRLWNKHNGEQLRVIFGHSKSVLSCEIGPTWLLTGGADHEVRVWRVTTKNKHSARADCTYRLMGHDCAVTCVRYGKMEILSGDVQGRIFIWWMATGAILRKCLVHKGPVKCMQFDSVHIVSGGVDCNVVITDIATGQVLQSLHGHTGHVLGLAFDSERILSAGGDNTVRYWQWGKKSGPQDKYHVLNKNETMLQVSKLHGLTLDTLMKWNGIVEMKQTYVGMKLLVRKGDPDMLTDAEKAAAEREQRRQNTLVLTGKKLKDVSVAMFGSENTIAYDRVHKLATDIDFYSLGNRLFGREKRQLELFPDQYDTNTNSKSLASRLQAAASDPLDNSVSVSGVAASKVKPRYFISADNEDEWGEVSDTLGVTMLSMLVEYTAYEVVMEQKRALRSNQSVIGRVNAYQKRLSAEKDKVEKDKLEGKLDTVAEGEEGADSTFSSPAKSEQSDMLELSSDSIDFSLSPAKTNKPADKSGGSASSSGYETMSSSAKHKKMEAKKAERARLKQLRKEQIARQKEMGSVEESVGFEDDKEETEAREHKDDKEEAPRRVPLPTQQQEIPSIGAISDSSVVLPPLPGSAKVVGVSDPPRSASKTSRSSIKGDKKDKERKKSTGHVAFTLPPIV